MGGYCPSHHIGCTSGSSLSSHLLSRDLQEFHLLLVVLLLNCLDLILILLLLQLLPLPQQELLKFLQNILLQYRKFFKFIVCADVIADHASVVLAVADVHGYKDLLIIPDGRI